MEDPRAEPKVLAWEEDNIGAKNRHILNPGQVTQHTSVDYSMGLPVRAGASATYHNNNHAYSNGGAKHTLPRWAGKWSITWVRLPAISLILPNSGELSQAAKSSGRDTGDTLTGHSFRMKLRSPQSCSSPRSAKAWKRPLRLAGPTLAPPRHPITPDHHHPPGSHALLGSGRTLLPTPSSWLVSSHVRLVMHGHDLFMSMFAARGNEFHVRPTTLC